MLEIVLLVLTGWDEERMRNERAVSQFALLVTLHRPSSLLRVVKVNEPRNSEMLLRKPLSLYIVTVIWISNDYNDDSNPNICLIWECPQGKYSCQYFFE